MSHSAADGATTTPSRDTMTQASSAGPAAAELGASEEPAVFTLPVELQKTVVEYLTSYRDMKSACLVCKQLNLIATPYLYRKMEVTGEFLDSNCFKKAITTKSPGLPSVKTVRIVHPYPRSARIGQAACLLLSTIPRNSLTRFELPVSTSPRVAREIFDCVRLKQGKVDNHQYDSICLWNRYGDKEEFAADVEYLARLKHLRLCLWEAADSRQAKIVLDSMHELTSLDLDLGEVCYTRNPFTLHLVSHALSAHYQRPCIRSLRLCGIDLYGYGDTIPRPQGLRRLEGLRNLKHLQLAGCINYSPFLQMLTALSLDLATLAIKEVDLGRGSFNSDANNFIQSLSSPERLSLTLDSEFEESRVLFGWSTLLDWSTLHKFASVIKSLEVQYHSVLPPYPSDQSLLDFRRFCKNASSLEQLSMSGIQVSVNKISEDEHTYGSLGQFLDCVRTVSSLVVLKLTVWMNCDTTPLDSSESLEDRVTEAQVMAHLREHLIKKSADTILSTLASACPRLNVVVIETKWMYGKDNYAVRAFLKSKQTDLYGRTTIVGMPVELCMVKHYEPCSDILEPDRFVFA